MQRRGQVQKTWHETQRQVLTQTAAPRACCFPSKLLRGNPTLGIWDTSACFRLKTEADHVTETKGRRVRTALQQPPQWLFKKSFLKQEIPKLTLAMRRAQNNITKGKKTPIQVTQ